MPCVSVNTADTAALIPIDMDLRMNALHGAHRLFREGILGIFCDGGPRGPFALIPPPKHI